MSSVFKLGPTLPEPLPGRPVEQPIRDEGGNQPPRVKVHTELGIPIYFNPINAQFSAQVGGVQGRGSTSELHSPDFAAVIERIRLRALVTPVRGYLVNVNHGSEDGEALVSVIPCTVIEHHPRRQQPFVVRVTEAADRRPLSYEPEPRWVSRIRSASDVLLPTPEHIEAVWSAQRAVLDEERRHRDAQRRLYQGVAEALEAIPRLTTRDLQHVQESQQQIAQEPDALGAVVYETEDDEEEVAS